jgi:hypothetical protein
LQNLASVLLVVPQFGHARSNGCPQFWQKRASDAFSCAQFWHLIANQPDLVNRDRQRIKKKMTLLHGNLAAILF